MALPYRRDDIGPQQRTETVGAASSQESEKRGNSQMRRSILDFNPGVPCWC